jgi:hypothetical protein
MFEVVTHGATPYLDLNGRAVVRFVTGGGRIGRPTEKIGKEERCPVNLYDKMIECWHPVPQKRPSFRNLERFLRALCRWRQEADS